MTDFLDILKQAVEDAKSCCECPDCTGCEPVPHKMLPLPKWAVDDLMWPIKQMKLDIKPQALKDKEYSQIIGSAVNRKLSAHERDIMMEVIRYGYEALINKLRWHYRGEEPLTAIGCKLALDEMSFCFLVSNQTSDDNDR